MIVVSGVGMGMEVSEDDIGLVTGTMVEGADDGEDNGSDNGRDEILKDVRGNGNETLPSAVTSADDVSLFTEFSGDVDVEVGVDDVDVCGLTACACAAINAAVVVLASIAAAADCPGTELAVSNAGDDVAGERDVAGDVDDVEDGSGERGREREEEEANGANGIEPAFESVTAPDNNGDDVAEDAFDPPRPGTSPSFPLCDV